MPDTPDSKRAEIVAHVARELGLGALDTLSPADRSRVEGEADDAIERWSEAEVEQVAPLPVTGDLQRLLSEHRDLEELVMDERDARLADEGEVFGREDDA